MAKRGTSFYRNKMRCDGQPMGGSIVFSGLKVRTLCGAALPYYTDGVATIITSTLHAQPSAAACTHPGSSAPNHPRGQSGEFRVTGIGIQL